MTDFSYFTRFSGQQKGSYRDADVTAVAAFWFFGYMM